MFWNRESDFYCSSLSSVFIFIFLDWLYFNILPPAVFVSLSSSSVDISSYLLHSLSVSLKWDPIMFFPSCSPPTLRWGGEPPAGGIKDMIYRAPSQKWKKKKREKKCKWEISFPAKLSFFSSAGFTLISFDLKYGVPAMTWWVPILWGCRSANM